MLVCYYRDLYWFSCRVRIFNFPGRTRLLRLAPDLLASSVGAKVATNF
jgi:hypothetical protein